jgi:glucose/arabinose dehydrogenase
MREAGKRGKGEAMTRHADFGAGRRLGPAAAAFALLAALPGGVASAQDGAAVRTGAAAFGDWQADAPGVWRRIEVKDLPAPFATPSASKGSAVAPKPEGAALKTLPGLKVELFASGLENARQMRVAPNGDVFLSQGNAGRISVLRLKPGAAKPEVVSTFAENLDQPFGMAFYPAVHPKWVYVANTDSVVRFPYQDGDLKARGAPETVVAKLTPEGGGHWTRDIQFSPDGQRMYVSVGSASNVAEEMPKKSVADAQAYDREHGFGAAWGPEAGRADVMEFTPDGKSPRVYAAGIRNCVGLMLRPGTDQLWCAVNERDGLGDNLVPDYVTRVKAGAYYGWPWYWMGDHEDPRRKGERPDLAGKVTTPDVPLQAHSAALQIAFYPTAAHGPAALPSEFSGDAFVTLHGSWNRQMRTGYKLVRVKLKDGVPTGAYEDVLTGFVIDAKHVWGRPVGVAVAPDGALLVSEDGNGTIWRITPAGR